jgi:hypothetical protein
VETELKGTGVKNWKDWRWKAINGRKLWRRPRPKLGCKAKVGGGGIEIYTYICYHNILASKLK